MNKQKKFITMVATVGIVGVFLPWASVTEEFFEMGLSDKGISMWQGVFTLLGFATVIGMCFGGNQSERLEGRFKQRVIGAAIVTCGFVLIQLINVLLTSVSGASANSGFGLFLSLLAGAMVVMACLKNEVTALVRYGSGGLTSNFELEDLIGSVWINGNGGQVGGITPQGTIAFEEDHTFVSYANDLDWHLANNPNGFSTAWQLNDAGNMTVGGVEWIIEIEGDLLIVTDEYGNERMFQRDKPEAWD